MEKNLTKSSNTTATFSVSLTEADYQPRVEKTLKQYAKTAQIKGFRPGHVPFGHVQKLYGKSVMFDEVIKLVDETLQEYVRENKLNVVGDPVPADKNNDINWEVDKTFDFSFELGMASDFQIDLAAIPALASYNIEPTAEKLEEAVLDMQKRYPATINPEEAEKGDFIFGDLTKVDIAFTKYVGIPTERVVEDAQFRFVGLEKGSEVNFDIQSVFEDAKILSTFLGVSEDEAAALTGDYTFKVAEISRQVPSAIDQAFFDKVLGPDKATNETEFRDQLKSLMIENYNREADYLLTFEAEKALLVHSNIELPDAFLQKWLVEINNGKFTEEQVMEQYEPFARGLRLDLIKAKISETYPDEIKVQYEDVLEEARNEIRQYMGSYSMNGMESFIDNMAKDSLKKGNKNAQANFRKYSEKAFGLKVMELVKSKINLEVKNINVDEFVQIAETITAK